MKGKRLAWDLGLGFIALMSFAGGLLLATNTKLQLGQLHEHFTEVTKSAFMHHWLTKSILTFQCSAPLHNKQKDYVYANFLALNYMKNIIICRFKWFPKISDQYVETKDDVCWWVLWSNELEEITLNLCSLRLFSRINVNNNIVLYDWKLRTI